MRYYAEIMGLEPEEMHYNDQGQMTNPIFPARCVCGAPLTPQNRRALSVIYESDAVGHDAAAVACAACADPVSAQIRALLARLGAPDTSDTPAPTASLHPLIAHMTQEVRYVLTCTQCGHDFSDDEETDPAGLAAQAVAWGWNLTENGPLCDGCGVTDEEE